VHARVRKSITYLPTCFRLQFLVVRPNNTQGDSDEISTPAGFCRHLVGKTLRNVRRSDIAEIRSVGKLVNTRTFS